MERCCRHVVLPKCPRKPVAKVLDRKHHIAGNANVSRIVRDTRYNATFNGRDKATLNVHLELKSTTCDDASERRREHNISVTQSIYSSEVYKAVSDTLRHMSGARHHGSKLWRRGQIKEEQNKG